MIYYLGLVGVISLFRLISLKYESKRALKNFYIFSAIVVILFQGLRSFSVGTDLQAYIPAFSKIGENVSFLKGNFTYANFEIGYIFLNKILYVIGVNERLFLCIIAAIIQIPIFVTIYKNSDSPLLSILVYFAFGNFFMTFSGLRQAISMSFCFAAYTFIKNKKPLKFILIIAFATLFHKSSLICLILYPLYHIRITRKYIPLILLGIIGIFLLRNQIFALLSKIYYGEVKATSNTGAYTMFAMYLLLLVVSFINKEPDKDYIGLRNILLMLVCIYALASVHDYVTRIGYPLSLYLSIFVPRILKNLKPDKSSSIILRAASYFICIGCFCIFTGSLNTLPFSFL